MSSAATMTEHTGNSALFGFFIISVYSLIVIPYTIYYFCGQEGSDVVQPWKEEKKKQSTVSRGLKRLFSKGNLVLLLLWVVWFVVLVWVQRSAQDLKPFDPFEILQIERSATDKEIKKAYRQLSLRFHPDKNPDPAAAKYFAESITKAYQALTDEVSRKNYEKYGHPDGPQGMQLGIALPEWFFTKDKKTAPLMLLALVGGGILLPLGFVSWYVLSSNKYVGPNQIMNETIFFFMHAKFCVKESQGLVRIPETLVSAMEFITLPTPPDHTAPLEELRRMVLRHHPDLKEKPQFWKRKASVLKAHLLILEHLERGGSGVPAALQNDLKFVLQKVPVLLDEIVKIAALPRPPLGYGWMAPAVAAVEMMQCWMQAVSIEDRKPQGKGGDSLAPLLQLPHMDVDTIKKLRRKKINNLKELSDLSEEARAAALSSVGLDATAVGEVNTFLCAMPSVYARAVLDLEKGEEIMEQDVAKCRVTLVLTRPSHKSLPGFSGKGKAVRAYTPQYPLSREEAWYLLLVDPGANALLAFNKVTLMEAEAAGFKHPDWEARAAAADAAATSGQAAADGKAGKALAVGEGLRQRKGAKGKRPADKRNGRSNGVADEDWGSDVEADAEDDVREAGQVVELAFAAYKAGRYDLQLLIMSDCWVGVDRAVPLKLKVAPLTRAAQEGRDARSLAEAKKWESDEEEDEGRDEPEGEDDDAQEGEEDEEGEEDYDSEETGEEESGEEDEEEEEEEEER